MKSISICLYTVFTNDVEVLGMFIFSYSNIYWNINEESLNNTKGNYSQVHSGERGLGGSCEILRENATQDSLHFKAKKDFRDKYFRDSINISSTEFHF